MAKRSILTQLFDGVDMHTNPLVLGESKVAEAINLKFQEGKISTRDGITHHSLNVRGPMQGSALYSPSRGLSHQPFSDPKTALTFAVAGTVYYSLVCEGEFQKSNKICGEPLGECFTVNLFQAENYLIIQNQAGNTAWWEGKGCYVCSPGFGECGSIEERVLESRRIEEKLVGAQIDCCFQEITYCKDEPIIGEEEPHDSHDTLDFDKHKNFLINGAGLGIYAHGRIHQQGPYQIFVSDLIHKRGPKMTDDILLMEEQQSASMAPPLSTNSKMGQLRAMEILPQLNSANGEGELIAYYDRGVVSYNTGIGSRESRYDAEGKRTREGWDTQRQVTHILNSVSAVGRYAVHALPRDHVFRSKFGLHFLKTTIGEGSFRDEFINTFSQDVQPILDFDSPHLLTGTSVSQWQDNHRIMTTVGMRQYDYISSQPLGRGVVVWNQATRYTEDRTPRSTWEGLWVMDSGMAGFHRLMNVNDSLNKTTFGGLTSDDEANVYFSEFVKGQRKDVRDGESLPIEWRLTTGKEAFGTLSKVKEVKGGRLEVKADPNSRVRVMVNTDETDGWEEWCSSDVKVDELSICNIDLGAIPSKYREASWYQFRIEGIGYMEIIDFEIEFSAKADKLHKKIPCKEFTEDKKDFFNIADKPTSTRWKH